MNKHSGSSSWLDLATSWQFEVFQTQYDFLIFEGGPHQYSANQTNFSRCAVFSFFLNLEPIYIPSILPCPGHPALPTDLSVPKYFGSSNQVHFQDSFRILFGPYEPLLVLSHLQSGLQSQHTITFRVRARSLFRAYTEPRKANDVEIEFSLFENGMQLVHPSARAFDEEVSFQNLVWD